MVLIAEKNYLNQFLLPDQSFPELADWRKYVSKTDAKYRHHQPNSLGHQ